MPWYREPDDPHLWFTYVDAERTLKGLETFLGQYQHLLAAVPSGVKLDEALYVRLKAWVEKHYRDRLLPGDLADPLLLHETRKAMDALERIFGLSL